MKIYVNCEQAYVKNWIKTTRHQIVENTDEADLVVTDNIEKAIEVLSEGKEVAFFLFYKAGLFVEVQASALKASNPKKMKIVLPENAQSSCEFFTELRDY